MREALEAYIDKGWNVQDSARLTVPSHNMLSIQILVYNWQILEVGAEEKQGTVHSVAPHSSKNHLLRLSSAPTCRLRYQQRYREKVYKLCLEFNEADTWK